MDETGLVLALAQGDRAALEDTIRRYTHYVAAVAARALAPEPLREDLEEVVSDTFLALWRSRESLDPAMAGGDRPESGHRPGQKAAGNGRHSRPSSRQPAGPRRAGGAEPAPQSAPTAGGQHGGAGPDSVPALLL